jgi:hypothetical protein
MLSGHRLTAQDAGRLMPVSLLIVRGATMKRPIKILLVAAITAMSLVVLLFVGGFIYFHYFFTFDIDLFGPGPIWDMHPEAWAQGEFPLMKYVEAKKGDMLVESSMSWGLGGDGVPVGIKAVPKGLSDKARWFAVPMGRATFILWGWSRPTVSAVLDESSSPPKLYVDAARTGDLSEAQALLGAPSGLGDAAMWFGPVAVEPVAVTAGRTTGDATVKVFFVYTSPRTGDNQWLRVCAAGYMAGEVKLDGQAYRVAVIDRNMDGRYARVDLVDSHERSWQADALALDLDQDGQFSAMEVQPLMKAVHVRDAYYTVPDGSSSIRFEKYEPRMGTLDLGAADATLVAMSDTLYHNLTGLDGKWQVPEGRYRSEHFSLSKTDAEGAKWTLKCLDLGPLAKFEVRGGETTGIKIGPPLALKVDAGQPESGQITLKLALVGKAGETYSVGLQKGTSRLPPPKVKVLDASGKVLAEGSNSEYG